MECIRGVLCGRPVSGLPLRAFFRARFAAPSVAAALQAVVAGILFSTGGAAVKATTLDAWQVAGLRSLFAAAALLTAVPAARRWAGRAAPPQEAGAAAWRREPARRRALLFTLGTGCCYCLTLVLFVHASKRTTAAEAVFLQSTAPLFVLLLSPFLLRERPTGRQLLLAPLFAAGLLLALLGGAEAAVSAPDPRTGNVFAVFCGLAYGLTLIGLRAAGRPSPERGGASASGPQRSTAPSRPGGAPGVAAAACGNVIVCLACLPAMTSLHSIAPADLAVVAGLGLFQVALAYALVARAARVLPAPVLALLLLLEPALGPFWALRLHGEQPHLLTWLGGAVIAAATVLLATMARGSLAAESLPDSAESKRAPQDQRRGDQE